MHIVMIGTGYVGLVSGVCFSEFGFDVTCVDVDQGKIDMLNKGQVPIFEPGLDVMMARNVEAGRLSFTTNFDEAVTKADVVFIAVGTPSRRGDGEADLSYVEAATKQIAHALRPETIVVIKSTVVVGTCRWVQGLIKNECPDLDFSIASNPEFLREGAAIEDFMRPNRVIVGVDDERAETIMRKLYRPLNIRETPMVITSLENAELIKYAANAFLAMKITFINEVANLCEKTGGNVQEVAKGIGLDGRIGSKFLHAGPGFGGSCFPKDTQAFAATGRKYQAPQTLIEQVITVNENRKRDMGNRILKALGGDPKGKTVGILGIAFKPNTDDVRDAPSLTIIPLLQDAGVIIRAHDPEARAQASRHLSNIHWCDRVMDVAEGADILVILTEWNEYRVIDLKKLESKMNGRILMDMRNIYKRDDFADTNWQYIPIGKTA